ncbi:SGNH/GDSL hydrolase family protein [Aliisedimentitalea scapharcae]|uniref:SGNH/GDSL hydrolase family protein n=1 Tax=Aliisedimentitalea scapharcae TaxID=1524259 RepID=A0ABZ2XUJ1_9RHOB
MLSRLGLFLAPFLFLSGCGEVPSETREARILAVGDSLMATHSMTGRAISNVVEQQLNEEVVDRSVIGARMIYNLPVSGAAGMSIPKQFRTGDWDWVIVNGGGNDLWLGCGCFVCKGKMNKLISEDGRRGTIPGFLYKLRQTGAQVIYVGYLRSPGLGSPIEHCRDEGEELERRIDKLADLDPGVHFLSLADLVPHGDRSFHGIDMIHPSLKASDEIGNRVAAIISNAPAPAGPNSTE